MSEVFEKSVGTIRLEKALNQLERFFEGESISTMQTEEVSHEVENLRAENAVLKDNMGKAQTRLNALAEKIETQWEGA